MMCYRVEEEERKERKWEKKYEERGRRRTMKEKGRTSMKKE